MPGPLPSASGDAALMGCTPMPIACCPSRAGCIALAFLQGGFLPTRQQSGRSPSPMRLREFGSSKRRRSKPKIISACFQKWTARQRHASRVNCRTDQALSELKTPYNEHVAARQHPQCLRNCAGCEGGCASSRRGSTSLPQVPHQRRLCRLPRRCADIPCRETMATITMMVATLKARAAN